MAPTKQPRISDNGKEPRRFTCMSCNKSFKRSEHCARHELMHTQERPFPCRKCGKRDLLRRHERTIHAEQYVNNAGHDMPENSPSSNASENPDPCDPPIWRTPIAKVPHCIIYRQAYRSLWGKVPFHKRLRTTMSPLCRAR
ncbi:hypothetical protein N7534_012032 [Penicillium rubens]|nr:hypothetical protein N7534_012032 [Penicillium rubens]